MDSLEEKLGYKFTNSNLLEQSLTHPSLAYETKRPHYDNQRLEYLGDAVIQLILTDELYKIFPDSQEGILTKLRSRLVSGTALCRYAKSIDLGSHLLLGKGEDNTGGRERCSNLADAFEAVIGAVYLDSGFETARTILLQNFREFIQEITDAPTDINPKGQLQEKLQAISADSPKYRVVSQEGPDHKKLFVSEVSWREQKLGTGSGSSKKESETAAAISALRDSLWITLENSGDKQ